MPGNAKRAMILSGVICLCLAAAPACSAQPAASAGAPRDTPGLQAGVGGAAGPEGYAAALDAMDAVAFREDRAAFASPERGWYRAYGTDDTWDIDELRSQGITLVLLKADLKEYTDRPIGKEKLLEIQRAFDRARQYGLQVMFRAAYDFDGVKNCEPESLSVILGHIAQLKELFNANEDILYCVQAGFLGPWGEWHSSRFGDPPSLEARRAVLLALMDAVPKTRSIQVRRPMFIRDIFRDEPGGSALSDGTAFSGSALARTGYHDDALFSTQSESGTYEEPGFNREAELNWLDNQDKYVPFAAESNRLSTYSDPANAVYELNKLHAQAVDAVFFPAVIAKWKASAYGGTSAYDYISQRLGYRLILVDAAVNAGVRRGGALHLRLRFRNDGFGNLVNPRPVEVVLSNGTETYTASIEDDPRRWFRECGTITRDLYFSMPSGISPGKWRVYMNLPSAYPSLRDNPLYSVRFANLGTWEGEQGYNLIWSGLDVDDAFTANTVDMFRQISRQEAELLCD